MNIEDTLKFRRSVRYFDKEKELDTERVKHCIQLATLAPNSSNMQLWEFYHITDAEIMTKLSYSCFNQQAATTAKQMVVFVTRRDLYRRRAKTVLAFEKENIKRYSPQDRQVARIKKISQYYEKFIPFLYSRFFFLLGWFRKTLATIISLFRPMITSVTESDTRIIVHKSCALAAQTFMIAMAEEGYDTCPLEGFDSRRVKKILNLPCGAEINMIIPCGIRKGNQGIWGERFRVPFNEVYKQI